MLNQVVAGLDRLGRVTILLAMVGLSAIVAREIINRGGNAAKRYI